MIAARPHVANPAPVRMPAVKICGIMQPEHGVLAASCGANMIGFVFAQSKRQITVDRAGQIAARIRDTGGSQPPLLVGVFVNETAERMVEIARAVALDVLQLSGDESPEDVALCARHYPVLKGARFPAGSDPQEALKVLHTYERALSVEHKAVRFLIDTYQPGEYGGTGKTTDWHLASELARRHRIVLAGGLNPGNVAGAIVAVRPWGVDVSSGVESGGAKDPALIREFLLSAKERK